MRRFFRGVSGLFSRLKDRFGRRKPHRRIAVIGLNHSDQGRLVLSLFGAEDNGTILLHTDDPNVKPSSPDAGRNGCPECVSTTSAIYLNKSRWRRVRRWEINVPHSLTTADDKNQAWKTECDTAIVTWPADRLGGSDIELDDVRFRITGAIGAARANGRLRRLALVVTGLGAAEGLVDECQQMLTYSKAQPFGAQIREQLQLAQGSSYWTNWHRAGRIRSWRYRPASR